MKNSSPELQDSDLRADAGGRPTLAAILLIVFCLVALGFVLLLPPLTMKADAVYQGF